MSLEELGGIGEFIGALAVLASLVYLATEIRRNTQATRLATLQSTLSTVQQVFDAPAGDAELTRIIRLGMVDTSQLNEDEAARLGWWLSSVLRAAENTFVQHQAGMLDDPSWAARAHQIRNLFSSPAVLKMWGSASEGYREDFRDWVSSLPKNQATYTPAVVFDEGESVKPSSSGEASRD